MYGDALIGSRKLDPSLSIGGDIGELAALRRSTPGSVRFFLGFWSWSPLQLSIELECGIWVHTRSSDVASPTIIQDLVLGDRCSWHAALEGAGLPVLAGLARTAAIKRKLADAICELRMDPS
jgi:putative AlgH/UPF0301 family transcriptional regulator